MRSGVARFGLAALMAVVGWLAPPAAGQSPSPAEAPTDSPVVSPAASHGDANASRGQIAFADPVVDADARLHGQRTWAWHEGSTRWVMLEGEAHVSLGVYGVQARTLVIRIDSQRSPGRTTHHLTLYVEQAEPTPDAGATRIEGPQFVATAATTGQIRLATDLLREHPPTDDPRLAVAREQFDLLDQRLARPPLNVPGGPEDRLAGGVAPSPPAALSSSSDPEQDRAVIAPIAPPGLGRILPVEGAIAFNADRPTFIADAGDNLSALLLLGDVRIMFTRPNQNSVILRAENMVVFLDGAMVNGLPSGAFDASSLRGIYLEDRIVITDGDYTLRAPRAYYDAPSNRALLLDAVMFTFDLERQTPLYVRARTLQQNSQASWSATHAVLSNNEFAVPHVALGARRITIEERASGEQLVHRVTAEHATAQVGGVPVLYWPRISADAQNPPLRRLTTGFSDNQGLTVRSSWDLFALAGQSAPEGFSLTGDLDFRGEHGVGLGLGLDYETLDAFGRLRTYTLVRDHGDDEVGGRNPVGHDGDWRGNLRWQHRQYLRDQWELSLELGYVSDPAFLGAFFHEEADTGKPYETSAYVRKQNDDWVFTGLLRYDLNEFTAQSPTLQAPGYTVDKLPEFTFRQIGVGIFEDRLTYYGDTRLSHMRIRAGNDQPADRGFTQRQSQRTFGIGASVAFDQALEGRGVPTDRRLRLDSRHEIQAPIAAGPLDLTPYVVGRATAYDKDFDGYRGEDDNARLWGGAGLRLHMTFQRVYDQVDNRLLDVHRLRHLIEPEIDLFYAGSSLDSADLPVFDEDVEALADGGFLRLGLRNTLQTQRGGPGRYYTVDWLVINTDVVLRSTDADTDAPLPRYFPHRPEFSRGGDHFHASILWMLTDSLALTSDVTHNFESGHVAQYRVGAEMRHGPTLNSHVHFAEIGVLQSKLLTYGFDYRLTPKYLLGFEHAIDVDTGRARRMDLTVTRRLPRWDLTVLAQLDDIDDEQFLGFRLEPQGMRSRRSSVMD